MTRNKNTIRIATVAALAVAMSIPIVSHAAVAGYGSVVRINGEGKRICDSFISQGSDYWAARIRGRFEDDSGGFTDRFNLRTCFEGKSECQRFIDRIHHHVFPIEQIYSARCKAQG